MLDFFKLKALYLRNYQEEKYKLQSTKNQTKYIFLVFSEILLDENGVSLKKQDKNKLCIKKNVYPTTSIGVQVISNYK